MKKYPNTQIPKYLNGSGLVYLSLFLGIWVLGSLGICHAQTLTYATVAVTNTAGTTNGQTVTFNGSVRTWTNSVQVPSVQILTNSSPEGAATNLLNHLGSYPVSGGTAASYGSSTSVVVRSFPGQTLTVTLSDGWGEVSYSTNVLTSASVVRVPNTVEVNAAKTNIATGLVDWLNLNAATNQLEQAAPAMAQLVGVTNAQTISGEKIFSSHMQSTLTFSNTSGVYLGGGAESYGDIYFETDQQLGLVANNLTTTERDAVSGERVGSIFYNTTLGRWQGATAADTFETFSTDETTTVATLINQDGDGDGAELYNLGLIGAENGDIGYLNTTNGGSFNGTNSFSDIAFRRYAITSLANGNNAGIVIGTNTFVEVSGPSGAFAICGMTGSPSRDGHLVIVVNQTGLDMTIAHQSGVDAAAANRIITMTGGDRATTGNGAATFIYSAAASRWLLVNFDP